MNIHSYKKLTVLLEKHCYNNKIEFPKYKSKYDRNSSIYSTYKGKNIVILN